MQKSWLTWNNYQTDIKESMETDAIIVPLEILTPQKDTKIPSKKIEKDNLITYFGKGTAFVQPKLNKTGLHFR